MIDLGDAVLEPRYLDHISCCPVQSRNGERWVVWFCEEEAGPKWCESCDAPWSEMCGRFEHKGRADEQSLTKECFEAGTDWPLRKRIDEQPNQHTTSGSSSGDGHHHCELGIGREGMVGQELSIQELRERAYREEPMYAHKATGWRFVPHTASTAAKACALLEEC